MADSAPSFADQQFFDELDKKLWNASYAAALHDELEDRDYFTEKNVFWVPPLARWKTIRENAALAPDTEIEIRNGKIEKYTFRSAACLIDDALEAVEKENPRIKGFMEKTAICSSNSSPPSSSASLAKSFHQSPSTTPASKPRTSSATFTNPEHSQPCATRCCPIC